MKNNGNNNDNYMNNNSTWHCWSRPIPVWGIRQRLFRGCGWRLIVFFLRAAALMMYTTSLCSFHTTGFNIGLISQFSLGNHIYIIHRGDFFSYTLTLGGKLGYTELSNLPGGMGGRGIFLLVGGKGSFPSITIHTFFLCTSILTH